MIALPAYAGTTTRFYERDGRYAGRAHHNGFPIYYCDRDGRSTGRARR
jgi:hypothetical protein